MKKKQNNVMQDSFTKMNFILIASLLTLCVLACKKEDDVNPNVNTSWIRERVNTSNSGNITLTKAPTKSPELKWETDVDLTNRESPIYYSGVIYCSGNDGLTAVNASNGEIKWVLETGGYIPCPTLDDGILFFGNDVFYAVNAESGAVVWQVTTNDDVTTSPLVVDNAVYFGDQDGIYALDKNTGELIWSKNILGTVSDPSYYSGGIYIGNENGSLFCFNAMNGEIIWEFRTCSDPISCPEIQSAPAIHNGEVVFGDVDGKAYKVDALTGEQVWIFETDGRLAFGSAAVTDDKVYFTCSSTAPSAVPDRIVCLDMATGKSVWEYGLDRFVGNPIVVNDQVIFGAGTNMFSLDRQTGETAWSVGDNGGQKNYFVIWEGNIAVAESSGNLMLLKF